VQAVRLILEARAIMFLIMLAGFVPAKTSKVEAKKKFWKNEEQQSWIEDYRHRK
jgi:hypothetical protein